jgi:hypothetical protein
MKYPPRQWPATIESGTEIIPGFRLCPICEKHLVGVIRSETGAVKRIEGVSALFVEGGRICCDCEAEFKRTKAKKVLSPEERGLEKAHKQFLAGNKYPGIKFRLRHANGEVEERGYDT